MIDFPYLLVLWGGCSITYINNIFPTYATRTRGTLGSSSLRIRIFIFYQRQVGHLVCTLEEMQGCRPWGCRGCLDFSRSVNPISTRRGRLCPPNNAGTPGFSDLPTALKWKEIPTPNFWFSHSWMGFKNEGFQSNPDNPWSHTRQKKSYF